MPENNNGAASIGDDPAALEIMPHAKGMTTVPSRRTRREHDGRWIA